MQYLTMTAIVLCLVVGGCGSKSQEKKKSSGTPKKKKSDKFIETGKLHGSSKPYSWIFRRC